MESKTLGDFITIYQNFAESENKSQRTIETVTSAVYQFGTFLEGNCNPSNIKPDDLRRCIAELQSRTRWSQHPTIKQDHGSLSQSSIACYVRSIRSFWSWMANEGFIEHNTFSCVKVPRETIKVVDPLTPHEVSTVIKAIPLSDHRDYRERSIIAALYGTAARVSEILELEVPNVDFSS